LSTGALARVEGEGAMRIEVRDGELVDVQLDIYEPPRFFESLLRGRGYEEPADITARICGICPVAYQMSACTAIENALAVEVGGQLRDLRRILYCGEWIESHTLHIHFLHAPDFLGCDSVFDLAGVDKAAVERGLEIKKIGNEILETLGGRAVHPVNVKVGGFYRVPAKSDLEALRARVAIGLDLALEVVEWVGELDIPDAELPYELVAASDGSRYPMLGDRVVSDGGLDIGPSEFLDHIEEYQVPHSTALHARLLERGRFLVGPLARYSLHHEKLAPIAGAAARSAGLQGPCRNPFRSIVVRAVEVAHAFETALDLLDRYEMPDSPAVSVDPAAGPRLGAGVTEAPRGLLYHRYAIDDHGLIADADIVPPTAQNQAAIEHDLWTWVAGHLDLADEDLRRGAEVTIRNHDPCISCATHFLDLTVDRS